jgi:hypothetical protein
MSDKRPSSTLAAELDRTTWDYSPGRDGNFLLAPVARMFASVSWEFRPQHLGLRPVRKVQVISRSNGAEFETQPLEPIKLPDPDLSE